jgi:very-short-patch-repair endonuclease
MTVDHHDGQLRARPALRSRDLSGYPIGRDPRPFSRQLDALEALVESIPTVRWCRFVTAAALHGFDGYQLQPPFHLLLPHGSRITRFGHHLHVSRSIEPIDRCIVLGFPATSPTRTLIDLAATEPPARVLAALESALRDGLTSEDFLHRRIDALRARGRSGPGQLLAVMEASELGRGGHSWLEREFLRLLHVEGLPRPLTQQVLGRRKGHLVRVDVHFPGTDLVVELLGYRWHRTRLQMQTDSERMNALQLSGKVVLQFTYHDVVDAAPCMFTALRQALSGVPQNAA